MENRKWFGTIICVLCAGCLCASPAAYSQNYNSASPTNTLGGTPFPPADDSTAHGINPSSKNPRYEAPFYSSATVPSNFYAPPAYGAQPGYGAQPVRNAVPTRQTSLDSQPINPATGTPAPTGSSIMAPSATPAQIVPGAVTTP